MIVPQFLNYYNGYTAQAVLQEYAKTFFALVNSMFRLKAQDMLNDITTGSVAFGGDENTSIIKDLEKQAKGHSEILGEIEVLERIKHG